MKFLGVFFLATFASTSAQIPCDEAYGQFCPEESGWGVGDCLKKQGSSVAKECNEYIALHDVCREDIEKNCADKEYTGDLLVCLSEWTKPEAVSAACLEKLPKKEQPKEKKLSKEERAKADKRRRTRNKAAKMARGDF